MDSNGCCAHGYIKKTEYNHAMTINIRFDFRRYGLINDL